MRAEKCTFKVIDFEYGEQADRELNVAGHWFSATLGESRYQKHHDLMQVGMLECSADTKIACPPQLFDGCHELCQ